MYPSQEFLVGRNQRGPQALGYGEEVRIVDSNLLGGGDFDRSIQSVPRDRRYPNTELIKKAYGLPDLREFPAVAGDQNVGKFDKEKIGT